MENLRREIKAELKQLTNENLRRDTKNENLRSELVALMKECVEHCIKPYRLPKGDNIFDVFLYENTKKIDDFINDCHKVGREKITIPKKIDVAYFKNHPDFEIIYLQKYEGRFKHKKRNIEIFVSSLNQASLICEDKFLGIIFDYDQMDNFLST